MGFPSFSPSLIQEFREDDVDKKKEKKPLDSDYRTAPTQHKLGVKVKEELFE